jgi:hypothetical protein
LSNPSSSIDRWVPDTAEQLVVAPPRFVTRDLDGRLLRWRDPAGVLHAVELAPAASYLGVGAWWSRCGRWPISRSEAWGANDEVACPACRTIEYGI